MEQAARNGRFGSRSTGRKRRQFRLYPDPAAWQARRRMGLLSAMDRAWKRGAIGVGWLAALALAGLAFAWLYSESVIERHYPLLSMDVPVTDKPADIAHGRHLVMLMGCADCHGASLQGRALQTVGKFRIHAPNLTRSAQVLTDEEFARAIRDGLKPDGKSLWVMPSETYTYMSVADVAAVIAYVHSLPPSGAQTPPPLFKHRDRLAILEGMLEPVATLVEEGGASLDLGPRYDGGRYIARTSCASCHRLFAEIVTIFIV